jgi:ubiquinone/menaquinone biosynthesis C-methylase UbiE
MPMPASDQVFAGSVPQLYQSHMVPLIFEPYAGDMARRVARLGATRVLELAAGTGVLTRHLAASLPEQVTIVATDLNPPMLALARELGTPRPVQWQVADAMDLPFEDATFDLVVCQFGVMFFPDKARAYAQARRVLRPGGTLLFSVWDRIEENHFTWVAQDTLARRFPQDPPVFMARTPHGYGNLARIAQDLAQAGFGAGLQSHTLATLSRAAHARRVAQALCHGTPLRGEIEAREPDGLNAATDAVEAALRQRFGDGPVEAKVQAHILQIPA